MIREETTTRTLARFSRLAAALACLMLAVVAAGCGATDPSGNMDSDGDGYSDDTEHYEYPGSDPFDATDTPANARDTDGDGCSNYDETQWGLCNGNPFSSLGVPDSDGDGYADDVEKWSTPSSSPSDADDTPANPLDDDGDGCSNYDESYWEWCDGDPNTV